MSNLLSNVKNFLISEDGPTAVEYAIMLSLIIMVCITAVRAVGTNTNSMFEQSRDALT